MLSKFNVGDGVYYISIYKNEEESYIFSVEFGVIEKVFYNNIKNSSYLIDGQIFNEKQLFSYRYNAVHSLEKKILSSLSFKKK